MGLQMKDEEYTPRRDVDPIRVVLVGAATLDLEVIWITKTIWNNLKGSVGFMSNLVRSMEAVKMIFSISTRFAGNNDNMESTSGYLMTYAGGVVSWQSRVQKLSGLVYNRGRLIKKGDKVGSSEVLEKILEQKQRFLLA
ncbi:hypothetical protein Tco_1334630 [Tanacetum coccineum]